MSDLLDDLVRRVAALEALDNRRTSIETPIYATGTWTPAWTNLTVVGSPTYAGRYTRIGRMVFFSIVITAGGANTTSATRGSTLCNNLPITAATAGKSNAVNGGSADFGSEVISPGTTNAYMPTWAATNATITITGQYEV